MSIERGWLMTGDLRLVGIFKGEGDGEEVDISSGNEKVAFGLSQGSRLSMHRC